MVHILRHSICALQTLLLFISKRALSVYLNSLMAVLTASLITGSSISPSYSPPGLRMEQMEGEICKKLFGIKAHRQTLKEQLLVVNMH